MKKVEAVIKVSQFEEVNKALLEIEIDLLTYWDVMGLKNKSNFTSLRTISFLCRDQYANEAIQAIIKAANIEAGGEGKIFVSTIDNAFQICN